MCSNFLQAGWFSWGQDFPYLSRQAVRPNLPPVQWVPYLFSGSKETGAWHNHPPLSGTEDKERVELYLSSPSGPSWAVIGLS